MCQAGCQEDAVKRFEEGIKLEDGTMTLPAELKILKRGRAGGKRAGSTGYHKGRKVPSD